MQCLGDAFGGGSGVVGSLSVPEIQGEGVRAHISVGSDDHRALEPKVPGGLFQGGGKGGSKGWVGGHDEAGLGLDLLGQGLERGAGWRVRKPGQSCIGDGLGAGQR